MTMKLIGCGGMRKRRARDISQIFNYKAPSITTDLVVKSLFGKHLRKN